MLILTSFFPDLNMIMSSRFFTNENKNTLLRKFEGVLKNNTDIAAFDALVGYFRASGYFQIRPFLENVPKIRILVGINVDKILARYQSKGLLFHGDANQTLAEFLTDVKSDIQEADYSKEVEAGLHIKINQLSHIPLVKAENNIKKKIIGLTEAISSKKAQNIETFSLEQQIDNLVYRLYDLTYDEVKVIDPEFVLSREEYENITLED